MSVVKIFLVDDHILVRDGIKALLEDQLGFEVVNEASNGIEALELLSAEVPDLMIIDIRMPHMNGIELVKAVKQKYQDIRTVVLSMHDSEEYVIKAIEVGADGYLLKGASKDEFLKALHTIASGSKYFAGDISSIIMNNFVTNGKTNNATSKTTAAKEDPFGLTKRQKQILALVLQLKNNKEIAKELDISRRTAEVHRFNLMKKLNVKNIKELSDKAATYDLV